ncbi:MAG: prepilin-type N-terminal cleavage/methylation domain-containing protein [Vicinamibacterales bacterium]
MPRPAHSTRPPTSPRRSRSEAGFSLPELLIATALTMIVTGAATQGLMQMTVAQKTIWNRAEMHSGVRSATELLQQEIGQAGRVTLPAPVTTSSAVAAGGRTFTVNSVDGMFAGEILVLGAGATSESVVIVGIDTASNRLTVDNTGTGSGTGVYMAHSTGAPLSVYGGFSAGIVPTTVANGSTASVLKLFGDVNSDGNMLYVEYTCDTANGRLLRNVMAWNAGAKAAASDAQLLLSNIVPNPGGAPCFTYQEQAVATTTFVTDVAITLTARTEQLDVVTRQYQYETKALLNVSPRNVFEVWELASQGASDRVQPTPASITGLLP